MALFPLDWLLRRLISHGRLTVIDTDGRPETFGAAGATPTATIRIHDGSVKWKVLLKPGLTVGEAYSSGKVTLEEGTLRDLLDILLISRDKAGSSGLIGAIMNGASHVARFTSGLNRIGRAERNVRHHYDISHRLYELFLDQDMQYSCAYWREGTQTLEEAQLDKKRHIARKLLLEPGMEVLDIGSGWGGMALHLAREHGVRVTGVTLSQDQFETSVKRAKDAGLSDLVTFKLLDYRLDTATYDRIVSVGMFEHVGVGSYAEYFGHLRKALKPGGVALIHTIAKMYGPGPVDEWIRRYIFPGGYLPTLSELAPVIEKSGLFLADLENLRLHYAKTLEAWDERFQAARGKLPPELDDRFCRMWEFYLQSSERNFIHQGLCVFQMQLSREILTVPITRDYMYVPPLPPAADSLGLPQRHAAE